MPNQLNDTHRAFKGRATLPPTEAPLQIAGLQLRLAHLPLKYSHAICRSRYPK